MAAIGLVARLAPTAIFVAALAPTPAAAAGGGRTSQGEPVTVKPTHGTVKLSLGWRADCRDGGESFRGTVSAKRLKVRRGRFSVSERGSEPASDGATIAYQATLAGRVRGRTAKGTWRLVVSGPYDDESRFNCDTGKVSFPAKARKRAGNAGLAVAAKGKILNFQFKQPGTRQRPNPPGPPGPGGGGASSGAGGGGSGGGSGAGGADSGSGDSVPAPPVEAGAQGKIVFQSRACAGGTPQVVPLPGVRIDAKRDNGSSSEVRTLTTEGDGTFTVPDMPGDGPFDIVVVFEGPRTKVAPTGQALSPYRDDLGVLPASGATFELSSPGLSGVANIFDRLNEAAKLADAISPTPPPQVTAFGRWAPDLRGWLGDLGNSSAAPLSPWIDVGMTRDGSVAHQYERFTLTHEYGHQVQRYLTNFPSGTGGDHDGISAYPDMPALPFSEGFAHFFAAVLYGTDRRKGSDGNGGCRKEFDLGTTPATYWPPNNAAPVPLPRPGEKQWAQYQEMDIGAAFFRSAEALGAGNVRVGAADVLQSMRSFYTQYRTPANPRDVRDAILDFAASPEAVEQAVGNAFADQGISYGVSMVMEAPFLPKPGPCPPDSLCPLDPRATARITGPGGVQCDIEHAASQPSDTYFSPLFARPAFKGPISPGRHDDCYIVLDFRAAPNDGWTVQVADLFWDLPYFTDNAHHGKQWSVEVQLQHCGYGLNSCPYPVEIPVRVGTGRWHRPGEDAFLHKPLNEKTVDAKITSTGTWVTVATFDADGVCTVKTGPATGAECGVGRS